MVKLKVHPKLPECFPALLLILAGVNWAQLRKHLSIPCTAIEIWTYAFGSYVFVGRRYKNDKNMN